MATLIPALGACASRMTSGERRLAERLEQKLDDDDLLCIGGQNLRLSGFVPSVHFHKDQ